MISTENTSIPPEQAHVAAEGCENGKPVVTHGISNDGSSTGQEGRHVTPLARCICGCRKPLDSPGRGTPRKYATPACRTRAYRRRRDPCTASRPVHPSAKSALAQDGLPRWMHTLSSFVKRLLRGKVTPPRPVRRRR